MMKPKVSLARCAGYEKDAVTQAVRKAVDALGGSASFLRPGERVLVKPNLLSARKPEEGVDTHPEVVRAVVRLAKEAGCHVVIGDSPGGLGKNIAEIHEVSGMKKVAEEEGAELVRFAKSRNIDGYPVSTDVLGADRIVSVPKFKTHGITVITAGIKNMFGVIIGLSKAECHRKAPNSLALAKVLAKIYSIRKPDLSILDAVISMQGDGPASGELRDTGFIMASADAVAMDAVLSYLVGIEPLSIPVTKECHDAGLGEAVLGKIEVVPEEARTEFRIKNFKLPQTQLLRLVPNAVLKVVSSLIKFAPKIDPELCKKCNLCRLTCPVNAIYTFDDDYRIDQKKCIKCLCCHEVCPYRAIYVESGPLASYLWR